MHISTKTGYAVRALAELAAHGQDSPISVAQICERQTLPPKYIEQLFRKLKKKGIITSVHGAHGGYKLERPNKDISLKDIMAAVDENFNYTYCDTEKETLEYCCGDPCGFSIMWGEIKEHLDNYFSSITLDTILEKIEENA